MQAMEFVDANGAACATAAKSWCSIVCSMGVLMLNAGTYDNIIRPA
jgi:hypothetical protein